jgi:hypothetical protein
LHNVNLMCGDRLLHASSLVDGNNMNKFSHQKDNYVVLVLDSTWPWSSTITIEVIYQHIMDESFLIDSLADRSYETDRRKYSGNAVFILIFH